MTTQEKLKTAMLAAAVGFAVLAALVVFLPKKWPFWLRPIIAAVVGGGVMFAVAAYLLR